MGVIGDMQRFQQFQMGQAMTEAASNPGGGGASEGMGLGMGFAMANQMAQGFGGAGHAPPPPPLAAWHVAVDGRAHGPLDTQQLGEWAASGRLTTGTLVWSAGMGAWTPAGQVPQLAGLFPPPPPPPPVG